MEDVFGLEDDLKNEFPVKLPQEKYCVCCLRQNIPYINLVSCVHTSLIECISKVKNEYNEMFVCHICHAMLKNFETFKRKVEENFRILHNQTINSKQQRVHNLEISNIKIIDTRRPVTIIPVTQLHKTKSLIGDPLEFEVNKEIDYNEIILQNVTNEDKLDRPTFNEKIEIELKQEDINAGKELLPLNHGIKSEHNYVSRFHNGSKTETKIEFVPLIKKIKDKVFNSGIQRENVVTEKPVQNYLTSKTVVAQQPLVRCKSTQSRPVGADNSNCVVRNPLKTPIEPTGAKIQILIPQNKIIRGEKAILPSRTVAVGSSMVKDTQHDKKDIEIIKTVILNEDEMKLWRENERKKPAFMNQQHKCHDCVIGFDTDMRLQSHIKTRHTMSKGVNILCDICNTVWKSQATFVAHTKRHFTVYECVACGYRAKSATTIPEHYNITHGAVDFKYDCKHCDFVTESYRRSLIHKYKHKPGAQCNLCHKSYSRKATLKDHIIQVHETRKPVYQCKHCGRRFPKRNGLVLHEKTHGKIPVQLYCAKCDQTFSCAYNLNHHLNNHSNHSNEFRYICDACGAKYRCKTSLISHIEFSHLKVNQLECPQCPKVCRGPRALRSHVKHVHNKMELPRDKICDQCGKGFTSNRILKSHLITHSGERPYQCDQCPDAFGHSASMYTHKKLVHSGKPKKRQRRSKMEV